jgi:hypothetical protein
MPFPNLEGKHAGRPYVTARRLLDYHDSLGNPSAAAPRAVVLTWQGRLEGVGLVHQVLRRDRAAAMPYYWQAYGLAESVEESGDLYACSEIHRHLGFYYLIEDVRPAEAVWRLGYSLGLRARLGDPRRIPSGLVALGEAELAAGQPQRAVELLARAARLAREEGLLPWRIEDAERSLSEAEAALAKAHG